MPADSILTRYVIYLIECLFCTTKIGTYCCYFILKAQIRSRYSFLQKVKLFTVDSIMNVHFHLGVDSLQLQTKLFHFVLCNRYCEIIILPSPLSTKISFIQFKIENCMIPMETLSIHFVSLLYQFTLFLSLAII